jgi:hypothetical protein
MSRNEDFVKELKALLKKYDATMNLEDDDTGYSYHPAGKLINVDFKEWVSDEPSYIELGTWIEGE